MRIDTGYVPVSGDNDVIARRTKRAICQRTLADGRTKITVLQIQYVQWAPDSGEARYGGSDKHNWGWKIWRVMYGTADQANEYVAKVRAKIAEGDKWKVVAR